MGSTAHRPIAKVHFNKNAGFIKIQTIFDEVFDNKSKIHNIIVYKRTAEVFLLFITIEIIILKENYLIKQQRLNKTLLSGLLSTQQHKFI